MKEISDAERSNIEEEARSILKSFSATLAKVKLPKKTGKKSVGGFRKEGAGAKGDEDFRNKVFANAPAQDGEFIIAEKKEW